MKWLYDIECANWDQFILGAAVSESGDVATFSTPDECAEWYLALGAKDEVISHNGGGYDFLQLIAATADRASWSASMAGSSIVTARAKGGAKCRDSMRLFPMSLAKWTGAKTDTGLACVCGESCGGYCAISEDMTQVQRRKLLDYCINDCRITLRQWQEDTARLASEGLAVFNDRGELRSTLGAIAWASAAGMAGLDATGDIAWADYDAGRLGYYGGRTEVGRTYAASGHRYDVHAMYPYALTLPVPVGERAAMIDQRARQAYRAGKPGNYLVTLDIPDTDLPPVPHRFEGARAIGRLTPGRLLWATGRVRTWLSHVELQASERHGARILAIEAAHVWDGEEPIFRPYVEHIYRARRRAKDAGDDRWASVLKWYANSLTGKLAQQPETERLVVLAIDENPAEGWEHIAGRVYAQTSRRVSSCAMTWAAAALTARARVRLLDRLARHSGRWLYCDTDSTYLMDADERDVHESQLGAWGYEGPCSEWRALAPKLYRYRDETGAPCVRARGIPRPTWETIDRLADGETVSDTRGVLRLKSSGGTFKRRRVARSHLDAQNDRCGTRYILADGTTRPLHRTASGDYI